MSYLLIVGQSWPKSGTCAAGFRHSMCRPIVLTKHPKSSWMGLFPVDFVWQEAAGLTPKGREQGDRLCRDRIEDHLFSR